MTNSIKTVDEFSLKDIQHSLSDLPETIETPEFSITMFYLPFQDPTNLPVDGKYGGDSFSIKSLQDGRTFILFRNGVDHGRTGRNAIRQNTAVLEEILAKQVPEEDIAKKLQPVDVFERLDIVAYALNELLMRRYKNPQATAASTLIAGTTKDGVLRYVSAGDSCLALSSGTNIRNESCLVEKKVHVGFASINKMFKTDERFYVIREFQISPKDRILIASDGIIEAVNEQNELYGLNRLSAVIKAHSANGAHLISRINDDVQKFIETTPLKDDYTILILEKK